MLSHKFRVGEAVTYLPGGADPYRLRGNYTVTRLLPGEMRDLQYRVKCDRDGHERVVLESQLAARPDTASPWDARPVRPTRP